MVWMRRVVGLLLSSIRGVLARLRRRQGIREVPTVEPAQQLLAVEASSSGCRTNPHAEAFDQVK